MNPALLFIARRYLRGGRRHRFGGIVGVFSFLALLIGVASLVLVMSVMNGFHKELSGRFLKVLPHVTYLSAAGGTNLDRQQLLGFDGVEAVSASLEDFVLITANGRQAAVSLQAIDPAYDLDVVNTAEAIVLGDWQDFSNRPFGILLGMQMANILGVDVGDEVRANFSKVRVLPTGIYPLSRGFRVAGIYQTHSQIDSEIALVRLQDAEPFMLASQGNPGWRIRTPSEVNPLGELTALALLPGRLSAWQERLHGLYEAMRMEKIVVGAMLVMVVVIASFSLVASLLMNVAEKRGDIAVMRTMGATRRTIVGIFVLQSMMFGGLGVLLGGLIGSLVALRFSEIVGFFEKVFGVSVFNPNVYYVSYLPTDWQLADLLIICSLSLLICLLASILPARRAASVAPAEAIHAIH